MSRVSAGLLMYRLEDGTLQVLLAHPGGPFFRNKDDGAWTVPKGEVEASEDPLATAKRELKEETGFEVPEGEPLYDLGEVKQKGGKLVRAWGVQASVDPARLESNTFEIEWPPRSGRRQRFPEIDRATYFALPQARIKINPAQVRFLDRLTEAVGLTES